MRHRNDLMLLRIAQGDAYAMAAEYAKRKADDPEAAELLSFTRYMAHPTYHKLAPGTYTDDTQMSIANTEVLLTKGRACRHEDFIEAYFHCFKRDPRDGYSRSFQKILEEVKTADELRLTLVPSSTKNGAAMRSVVMGVEADPEWVKTLAMRQAGVTHGTYEGVTSSVAVALMAHYALYDRRGFSSMPGWLGNQFPVLERFREPWVGPVKDGVKHSPWDVGMNTAWAVHTLVTEETTLLGIMKRVLEWGGDTDSVAAIAWGIASCRMTEELPRFFEDDLERLSGSSYGPSFLRDLGKRLMDAYDVRK